MRVKIYLSILTLIFIALACSIEDSGKNLFQPLEVINGFEQSAQCPYGGLVISTGLDLNSNGTLDISEVTSSSPLCNGAPGQNGQDGKDGQDGFNTLINTEVVEDGYIMYMGLDINRNNILETSEITSQIKITHGEDGEDGEDGKDGKDGLNSLVSIVELNESMEHACEDGGIRVYYGLDDNADNILDESEYDGYADICECVCDCECECEIPYYEIEFSCCPDEYESKTTTVCERPALKITKGIVGKPELETVEFICLDLWYGI